MCTSICCGPSIQSKIQIPYMAAASSCSSFCLRKVPDEKGGQARYLSHLNEPNLLATVTDCLTFSAAAARSMRLLQLHFSGLLSVC